MPSAKPDKLFAATDLLTELPEGVRFRQAEVWAGLESTLQRRRQRVLLLQRLSVAAILLIALAIGWWMLPRTRGAQPEVVRTKTAQPAVQQTAAVPVVPVKEKNKAATAPTVEIRETQNKTPRIAQQAQVIAANAQPTAVAATDSSNKEETDVASVAVPAARRFRIAHLNDNGTPEPVVSDLPADDRSNYGLIHIPLTGAAGPNNAPTETVERRPRTLMSLFKPHQ